MSRRRVKSVSRKRHTMIGQWSRQAWVPVVVVVVVAYLERVDRDCSASWRVGIFRWLPSVRAVPFSLSLMFSMGGISVYIGGVIGTGTCQPVFSFVLAWDVWRSWWVDYGQDYSSGRQRHWRKVVLLDYCLGIQRFRRYACLVCCSLCCEILTVQISVLWLTMACCSHALAGRTGNVFVRCFRLFKFSDETTLFNRPVPGGHISLSSRFVDPAMEFVRVSCYSSLTSRSEFPGHGLELLVLWCHYTSWSVNSL